MPDIDDRPAETQFDPSDNRKWLVRGLLSRETLWDRTGALLCGSLQALLIARGILWSDCECVAKGTVRKPDPQVGIEHEQAFTDRLYEIQWVDFPHGRFLRTF